ncbi:Brp/Blh family beta-carotene 15,15'-dioxygenase [Algoriphagus confluentis]|uniref:Probable beta-carotene 15,15'-dioxygenase n=1 Tax=Algoriphagus confluentis TaxID=1697556 RepID=A0ABQ6PID6_9BACT|nr:Brp/Blh family beta-carotene 15,15'-dioxygenase [Algoriphagus confluentis]
MKSTEFWLKGFGLLICVLFVCLPQNPLALELTIAGLILITLGIPHGAIDHLTSEPSTTRKGLLIFLLRYLGMIGIYLILWIFFPVLSLAFFLLFSSYHFGQSHFFELKSYSLIYSTLFVSRGAFYIAVILFGDFSMTQKILDPLLELGAISEYGPWISMGFLVLSMVLEVLVFQKIKRATWIDLLLLAPLLYFSPLLISFIVYFGFWHAFPSMKLEYDFLRNFPKYNTLKKFTLQLLPFSLISLFGLALMIYFGQRFLESNELLLLFFILISLISFPHVVYMDRFVRFFKTDPYSA